VTGKDQFVYMAAYGAKIAAKNALNSNSLRYDNAAMPAVVFSDPQVASVGLTEAQAWAAGYAARTSVLSLDNVPHALAARDTRGLIKLVADGATRKLLGAHILAPEGAYSIQTAALAHPLRPRSCRRACHRHGRNRRQCPYDPRRRRLRRGASCSRRASHLPRG
jgi:mercuric reductase